MKLTYEQILSAANGVIRTEQNELGLELHRFTRDQEGFFYKTHPAFCTDSFFNSYFGRNCRTTAGITLDFISDLKTLKINFGQTDYTKTKTDRTHLFDLYVDGEWKASYKTETEILYNASGKQQRFTLYFPAYAFPIIASVVLEDATVFLPRKKPIDIMFLGDSITHGAFAVHPSNSYVMQVARNMDIGILNQGNSGFVYDAGSIEKVCEPKIVVTAYGINDFHRKNIEAIERETIEFLQKLKACYPNAKIVSILPLWTVWNGSKEDYKLAERNCIKAVYDKYSDYTVDGYYLVPHDAKYFADEVHPNDEGFAFYGENLTKALAEILAKSQE